MAVFDRRSLAEESIRFIEQQDSAAILGGVENPTKVLLRFANVFAHDRSKVDESNLEMQFARQRLGCRDPTPFVRSGKQKPGA